MSSTQTQTILEPLTAAGPATEIVKKPSQEPKFTVEAIGSSISSVTDAVKSSGSSISVPQDVASSPQAAQYLSSRRKAFLVALVLAGNMIQMISNGTGLAAGFSLASYLGVTDSSKSNWAGASYPLTQGTFVLVAGRLGAVYGHKNMLLLGGAWFSIWSLVNCACTDFLSFNIARGFTGIGGALILPNAIAMIGTTFPPGKERNFCLGIFGAAAPIGGYVGAVLSGIFTPPIAPWKYLFVTMGLAGALIFSALAYLLPKETPVDRHGKVDWLGAILGTTGLILFNFVWNQAPAVGWDNPYIIAILLTSILTFIAFALWESHSASPTSHAPPIMPLSIWSAPSFLPLMLVVVLCVMSYSIAFWYMAAYQQLIWRWSVLRFALGWTPFLFFGVFAAWLASRLVPAMPAQYIIALGALSTAITNVLVLTMPLSDAPLSTSYWAHVFPATIVMSFCPDLVFTAASIIASNAVKRSQQGIAASLVGVLLLYGNSMGLGFAGTIESQVDRGSGEAPEDKVGGYRASLWFGFAIAVVALGLDLWLVRMARDEREGWADEEDEKASEEDEVRNGSVGRVLATGVELREVRSVVV